jgi:hypothetical protein
MLLGIGLPSLPWFIAIGFVKLILAGALGLIGTGAMVRRLALRAEARNRLAGPGSQDERDG